MGLYGNHNLQITGRTAVFARVALSPQGHDLTVVDARGNCDLQGLALAHLTGTAAALAGGTDDLAPAAAARACAGSGKHAHRGLAALLDLAGTAAVGAGFRTGTGGRAGAAALAALLHPVQAHVLLAAKGRLFKCNGQPGAQALAPLGAAAGPGAAAEAAAEKAAEDIAQVSEVEAAVEPAAKAASAVVGVHAGEAELIVPGPLAAVAEHLIGLVDLLEPGLRRLVVRVEVRMVLLGELPVCLFNLRLCRALLDAQHFIIITLLFCHTWSQSRAFAPPLRPASAVPAEAGKYRGKRSRLPAAPHGCYYLLASSSSTTL